MIVFLVPVRHELGTADYNRTWALLNCTLSSIAAQDCDDWHVVVCANKVLPIWSSLPQHKITFIECKREYIARTRDVFIAYHHKKHVVDKLVRRRNCAIWARQNLDPSWYFMADADDFVSNDLVSSILDQSSSYHDIVTIKNGIVFDVYTHQHRWNSDINRNCGTTLGVRPHIIHNRMLDISRAQELVKILGYHNYEKYMSDFVREDKRFVLDNKLPYCAYSQHDDNHGKHIWRYGSELKAGSKLTEEIRTRFQIPTLTQTQAILKYSREERLL